MAHELVHIHQAANQFLVGIRRHPGAAVWTYCLDEFAQQVGGLVANLGIVGGVVHPRHSTEPLAKYRIGIFRAPATQRFAGGWHSSGKPIAMQNVVIVHIQVEIATLIVLFLPAAVP
jgi:hypothetical protein